MPLRCQIDRMYLIRTVLKERMVGIILMVIIFERRVS